jgi:Flp pilus assembly pilin Flp
MKSHKFSTDVILATQQRGTRMFFRFLRDDSGGEVLEYALIAGLIVVAAITTIAAVGTAVSARWSSLNSSM